MWAEGGKKKTEDKEELNEVKGRAGADAQPMLLCVSRALWET